MPIHEQSNLHQRLQIRDLREAFDDVAALAGKGASFTTEASVRSMLDQILEVSRKALDVDVDSAVPELVREFVDALPYCRSRIGRRPCERPATRSVLPDPGEYASEAFYCDDHDASRGRGATDLRYAAELRAILRAIG